MENLSIKESDVEFSKNLVRVADISYFEGPLLTLFEDVAKGHLYLFDWVDRNETFNRWIVYRVAPVILNEFVNGKISHFDIYSQRPNDKTYVIDIGNQNRFYDYVLHELQEVPEVYYPNRDNYFDASDCTSIGKIRSILLKHLSRAKQENEYLSLGLMKRMHVVTGRISPRINRLHGFIVEKGYGYKSRTKYESLLSVTQSLYNPINANYGNLRIVKVAKMTTKKRNLYAKRLA